MAAGLNIACKHPPEDTAMTTALGRLEDLPADYVAAMRA